MPKDLIITNNTHTVLMLSNLTQYNSGDYLCIAYSKHQSVWKTLYLQLQGLYAYWHADINCILKASSITNNLDLGLAIIDYIGVSSLANNLV